MQANIESGGKDASLAVVIHQGRRYRRDDFDSGWSRWEVLDEADLPLWRVKLAESPNETQIRELSLAASAQAAIAERDERIAVLEHENGVYLNALAACRDAFPAAPVGSDLDSLFVEAIGLPEAVPAYVKACADNQGKAIRDNLVSLVWRLAAQLRKARPESPLPQLAIDYVNGTRLMPSPRRADPCADECPAGVICMKPVGSPECGRIVQLRAEVDAHIAVSGSWATSESGARS